MVEYTNPCYTTCWKRKGGLDCCKLCQRFKLRSSLAWTPRTSTPFGPGPTQRAVRTAATTSGTPRRPTRVHSPLASPTRSAGAPAASRAAPTAGRRWWNCPTPTPGRRRSRTGRRPQMRTRPLAVESTQLEAEEADPSSGGQLCTSGHRVEAQSLSLTIKGPFWMAAPPAKDRPSPYAQAGDLSRNFILIAGWPWFVGSVQQYQLAVKPAMGDETRGQARDLIRWLDCPAGSSRKPSVCQQNQFLALKQNQMRAAPTIFIGSLLAPRIPPLSGGLLNLNYSFQKNTRWQPLKYVS
ncbi:uncharacterized protein [Oryctolagus cuniculus]|uniref:uncharacterized protein isoform X2 n=1 Tax=Oryctolagus cuniculus TaxID=9986 RepID=UPI0038798C0F